MTDLTYVPPNTSANVFGNWYCPKCLDMCKGYRQFLGTPHCITCDSAMKIADDPNEWCIIGEREAFRAMGDRVIVLEDPYKSGYECDECDGVGHHGVTCPFCKGTKFQKGDKEKGYCPDCNVGTLGVAKSLGYVPCEKCRGNAGYLIVPDDAKRRPPTGVIKARGKDCNLFDVGDRVMYTNYTGTDFELRGGHKVRIIKETDVMAEYKQLKKITASLQEAPPSEAEIVGVQRQDPVKP